MNIKAENLRKKFVEFFVNKDHKKLLPAPIVSKDDRSVLFTSAGMQQFKDYYMEPQKAPSKNIVTIQPCFRTSDINEVGDKTHHTFFEMPGNFSFGGYEKRETIEWGIEFLESIGIDRSRISASIFAGDGEVDKDEESLKILNDLGIEKIKEYGRGDNFWGPIGNEGPCGPTVELFVDGIEVWNLVFNQYYCSKENKLSSLKNLGVDTGLGFERCLSVLHKKDDNYETELFEPVIQVIEENIEAKYEDKKKEFRIIADHIRAAVFLLADGVRPSNIEQGYVLRRLIRRIIRYWRLIGGEGPILNELASIVILHYKNQHSHLSKHESKIIFELQKEEKKFAEALKKGLKEFEKMIKPIVDGWGGDIKKISGKEIPGQVAFTLYERYGFPLELTREIAEEKGLSINEEGFSKALKKHQNISRQSAKSKFVGGLASKSDQATKYHTATHLLLAALKQVLGAHVHQKGSNINEERLRFDFSYDKPMTRDKVKEVENIVNKKISENLPVIQSSASVEEAKKMGAEATFVKKYKTLDKDLTLYSISDPSAGSGQVFSRELCGGPHVEKTGELGKFKIIKEESSSAGVRRIKAILE